MQLQKVICGKIILKNQFFVCILKVNDENSRSGPGSGSGSISQMHGSADPDPPPKMSWIRNTGTYCTVHPESGSGSRKNAGSGSALNQCGSETLCDGGGGGKVPVLVAIQEIGILMVGTVPKRAVLKTYEVHHRSSFNSVTL